MDGFATIAEIRRREAPGSRVPILVVSAHAMSGERERALAAGADGYLPKPVIPEVLAEALGHPGGPAPGVAPPPPDAVIDPGALERLRALGGSRREFLPEMVALFLEDAPAQVAKMREAFSGRDSSRLRSCAHRLLGSCRYLGATGMTRTLDAIEAAAGSESWDRVGLLLERLDADFDVTRQALVRLSAAAS
jgi:CheY-like chemotaxis protein